MGRSNQKNKKKRNGSSGVSTGSLAKRLFESLASDFRREGLCISPRPVSYLRNDDISSFRQWSFAEAMNLEPMQFKMARQLNNFLSKYTFANDVLTVKLRAALTLDGWCCDATRIAEQAREDSIAFVILREARSIVKQILGPVPDFEHIASFGKFGTRATRKCGRSNAGLDRYVTNPATFSSSEQCLAWVTKVLLPGDAILNSLFQAVITPETRGIESIVLKLVPKKWDKDRPITPLQLIDLLYSYAYGAYVEIRLQQFGLNIQSLQSRHQKIVRRQSVTMQYATADMSGGSNNVTKWHMLKLTPRPWYGVFKRCLTHVVLYEKSQDRFVQFWTPSVLPMGNALTFPLETLYFYAVVEAIRRKLGVRGFVSCYGDDLIYPSRIHGAVVRVFKTLNWKLNLDKTYVNFPFRESCGADYYRGLNVRPFFFPDVKPTVSRMSYRRLLYQIYNGLMQRWDPSMLTRTLRFLLIEISMYGDVYRVPPDYPEYSGIRVRRPLVDGDPTIPYAKIIGDRCPDIQTERWTFRCLSETTRNRFAETVVPFYWDCLRELECASVRSALLYGTDHDPLAYLSKPEKEKFRWRRFARKSKGHGKKRKYFIYKMYVATDQTIHKDDLAQTFLWSDELSWFGSAGYTTT